MKIIIKNNKCINNEILKVGYRAKAKPYSGKFITTMDPKYINNWLDAIEEKHKGFYHQHNTYYGYYNYDKHKENNE